MASTKMFLLIHQKYFEELLWHRDSELKQFKFRFDKLKCELECEILQIEIIILELILELFVEKETNQSIEFWYCQFRRSARDEAELKRKKSQQTVSTTPPKNLSPLENATTNSPPTPTNNYSDTTDT